MRKLKIQKWDNRDWYDILIDILEETLAIVSYNTLKN